MNTKIDFIKKCNNFLIIDNPIEAVKQDGYALRYVKDQTVEICLEAVKQNGYALKYVKKQTVEICLEAVKQNGNALQYVNIFDKIYQYLIAQKMDIDNWMRLYLSEDIDNTITALSIVVDCTKTSH